MTKVLIDDVPYVPVPQLVPEAKSIAALEVRFDSDAGDNLSIREYLSKLLLGVWDEGEGFDGKRPFGNSSWESEPIGALGRAGFISGRMEDGYFEPFNNREAEAFVRGLICAMCGVPS